MKKKRFSFGKLAAKHDPQNRTLKMAKYMANVTDPPECYDNINLVYHKIGERDPDIILRPDVFFPLDGNDVYGDCVVAGMAHYLTLTNGRIGELIIPPAKEVIKFYKKLSGCKDQGLVMFDTLKYWRRRPFYNHTIDLFGRIDLKNHKLVKQCIWLFGGVDLGFQVQRDAIKDFEEGKTWTPGPTDGGGHCVIAGAYDNETVTLLTWGGVIKGTWQWWDAMVDEAFAILPPEAKEPDFAPGFLYDELIKDLQSITT